MAQFGDALRQARMERRMKLRELSEFVGKSVSYLSDIEHNRRRPPKEDIVALLEQALQLPAGHLGKIASLVRSRAPREMARRISAAPRLSEVLLRADQDLTESEFEQLMDFYEELKNRSERQ